VEGENGRERENGKERKEMGMTEEWKGEL